jgi:opacity protein-like surface antigen
MKNSIFVIILFCLFNNHVNSQFLQFGFKGGVNFSNYGGEEVEGIDFKNVTSYHFGLVTEFKLLENFSLQPELLYTSQGSEIEGFGDQIKNELGYIALPIFIKFYLTDNQLSLEAGPQFSFLVSERNEIDLNDSNSFEMGIGAGLSYKITNSIFLSGRYIAGLTDVKKDSEVKNSVVQFSVGFLF